MAPQSGLLFVLLGLLGVMVARVRAASSGDLKQYSYFCLESDQTLCLGISPGDGEPFYDPTSIYYLQVKSRTRTEYSNTDYKKTRWDANYAANKISLSRFPDLCAAKEVGSGMVGLFPCNQTQNWDHYSTDVRYGKWDLELFASNINSGGTLELVGAAGSQCLTVMNCKNNDVDWCDPASTDVAWDVVRNIPSGLRRGSYVRFRPCFDAEGGHPLWTGVQMWRQRLDCATGCSPFEQYNNVCDQPCNREECDFDNGKCQTRAPTPPTRKPTQVPTPAPTNKPTSRAPSQSPTNHAPTSSPSGNPTETPSKSPTRTPSAAPSQAPSLSPAIPCPPPGELEYCASLNQKVCTKNAAANERCVWCLDKCSPRSDPRVCFIPQLFDRCKAVCPTNPQRIGCPKALTAKLCLKGKWRKANCNWCGPKTACLPGKDRRMCVGDPTVFDHCGTIAPTGAPCPLGTVINMCNNAKSAAGCNKAKCTFCPGKVNPCRPTKALGICEVEYTTPAELISQMFRHCGKLYPTTRPTKAPTADTMVPSRSPTRSPATFRPSGHPTSKPSRSPTVPDATGSPVARPTSDAPTKIPTSKMPTKSPSLRPTKIPTSLKPSKAPTLVPTKLPTRQAMAPTKIPTRQISPKTPTFTPSKLPTSKMPSKAPTSVPTKLPTGNMPSRSPTPTPTKLPTSKMPSRSPTLIPTKLPTKAPTLIPTRLPTSKMPTKAPTNQPTRMPTAPRPAASSNPTRPSS